MLSVIRLIRLNRSPTSLIVNKPSLNSLQHCKVELSVRKQCFHTSSPRNAVPPFALIVLRPVLRLFAFFAGRNFRKWWQKLPKDRKQYYFNKIKENKVGIAGS